MTTPQFDEDQTRYVELRYDGERTISGVAMRYGDVATLYDHGDGKVQEKFEPGCFGNVRGLDVSWICSINVIFR